MAYNDKTVITDLNGNVVPQFYNPDTDQYEVLTGGAGANKVVFFDEAGNEVFSTQLVQPIVDKLDQLTGTVIAEQSRVEAEQARSVWEAYDPLKQYVIGNKVVYNGSSYYCIQDSLGNLPTNSTYWLLIASIGEQGVQGIQGETGNGISSIVRTSGDGSAGTIDTYTITYTNLTTTTFQVYNGADGLGAGDMLKSTYDTDGDGKVNSAVNADTVNGKTVAENVPVGAVFTDDQTASEVPYSNTTSGMTATTVQDAIDEINAAHNVHLTNNMPHEFSNIETNKTYKFGFQVSSAGKPQIIYEEVV